MVSKNELLSGSQTSELISRSLRDGDREKALLIIEQKYGPNAKRMLENLIKYTNMNDQELARAFEKVSDKLEQSIEKIEKHERLQEKIAKEIAEAKTQEEMAKLAEETAKAQLIAEIREQRFNERVKWYEERKKAR